jgi:hypothetical protein
MLTTNLVDDADSLDSLELIAQDLLFTDGL